MVMFLLVLDILYHLWTFRHRIGEGSISITPSVKVRKPLPMFSNPSRRLLLDDLHKLADRNRRMHLHTHVDMVRHRVDAIQMTLLPIAHPEDVSIEVALVLLRESALRASRAPDDMVCKRYMTHDVCVFGTGFQPVVIMVAVVRRLRPRLLRYWLPARCRVAAVSRRQMLTHFPTVTQILASSQSPSLFTVTVNS